MRVSTGARRSLVSWILSTALLGRWGGREERRGKGIIKEEEEEEEEEEEGLCSKVSSKVVAVGLGDGFPQLTWREHGVQRVLSVASSRSQSNEP